MSEKSFKQLVGSDGEFLSISVDDDEVFLSLFNEDGEEYDLEMDKNALVSIFNQISLLLEDEEDDEEDEDEEEEEEEEEVEVVVIKKAKKKK